MALIAVIDDDPDIIEATNLILTSKNHKVISAANLEDGYNLVKEEKPDLIILDVMLSEPDDGFFLAQKFRREKLEIPIIMYTSVSKALGLEFAAGEMVPVDDFVEKPISPDALVDKVEKLLQLYYKE